MAISKTFFLGASAAIIAFDLNAPSTIRTTEKWLKEFQAQVGTETPTFLVGNKSDLTVNLIPLLWSCV